MAIDISLLDKLRAVIKHGSQVLTPADPAYTAAIARWSAKASKPAGAVVLCINTTDIQSVVLFAANNTIDLAVRGGAHSTSGSSSSEGGIVLDLSLMRNVTVDPVAKTITAQGGCLWLDVDTAAGKHGLATVGGTVNHTGVGGLTLGGGYGWLSSRYGLAIDNLLSVTVVLANGSCVRASETENPDLFWAMRGAGPNFGVVTEFVFRAHPQPNTVWAGMLAFSPDKLPAICDFASHVATADAGMGFGFSAPPPHNQPCVIAVVYYNGPASEGKRVFAPLLALGPLMDTTAERPYPELNSVINAAAEGTGRLGMKGMAFQTPIDAGFAQRVFDEFAALVAAHPEFCETLILWEVIDPSVLNAVPQTATAFANRGAYMNAVVAPKWADAGKDELAREFARKIDRMFGGEHDRVRKGGAGQGGVEQYANYSGWFDDQPRQIYGVNTERLVELKGRYDPGNLFCKWNPVVVPVVGNGA